MRSSFSLSLLYHAYVYLEFLILACTIYILAPVVFINFYIYAGENLVALRKTTENQVAIYFVYSDNLGSIRCLTDFQGNVVQQLGYDAWGQRRNPLTGEKLTSIELIDSYRIRDVDLQLMSILMK